MEFTLTASRMAQLADYPAGATFGPRNLPDCELVWLVSGSARLTVRPEVPEAGTYDCTLRPGDLALVRHGERDHYAWDPSVPSRHAYLHFQLQDLGHLPDPRRWPRIRRFAEFPVLEGLSDYLLVLARDDGEEARLRSVQVLHWLVDLFVTGPLPADPLAGLPPPVIAALDRVRVSWAEEGLRLIVVTELAEGAHVSVAHLHRLFHESLGLGPARLLELVRLWQASTALQRSRASVGEVGRRCGYRDQFHFSRRFRGLYGVPPGAARSPDLSPDPAAPLRSFGLLGLAQQLLAPVEDGPEATGEGLRVRDGGRR